MESSAKKIDIEALKAQIDAEIAARPQIKSSIQTIDIDALKAQVDNEIAARLALEADAARYIHRRGFSAGGFRLLLGLDATSEVAEMPPLYRLPGAPAGIKGLSNRHGRVVPVVDISLLFGTGQDYEAKVWLLVCGRGEEAVGLVVDSLPERKKFAQEDEVSLSEITHPIASYARAAYREGQDVWLDLDMEAFFAMVFQVEPSPV
jgi:chemotaxis signal transduction protein